jgi:tRNA(Ile2) C34 agmatinyltransferase TiaS
MRLTALSVAALAFASCVGTPPVEKVAAEAEAAGACKALPEGVTCDCVISTAHASIANTKVERSKDDTGSRLGRGAIGTGDARVPVAIEAARHSCSAGKAVG